MAWAGSNRPRSQLVEPPEVQPAYRALNTLAAAWVETFCNAGTFAVAPVAGDRVEKENSAIRDGVPTSASTNVLAAVFKLGRSAPTDPEVSRISATSRPQSLGSTGL